MHVPPRNEGVIRRAEVAAHSESFNSDCVFPRFYWSQVGPDLLHTLASNVDGGTFAFLEHNFLHALEDQIPGYFSERFGLEQAPYLLSGGGKCRYLSTQALPRPIGRIL
jgi:hypothetical protein